MPSGMPVYVVSTIFSSCQKVNLSTRHMDARTHMDVEPDRSSELLDLVKTQFYRPFPFGRLGRRVFKVPKQRSEVDPHPVFL